MATLSSVKTHAAVAAAVARKPACRCHKHLLAYKLAYLLLLLGSWYLYLVGFPYPAPFPLCSFRGFSIGFAPFSASCMQLCVLLCTFKVQFQNCLLKTSFRRNRSAPSRSPRGSRRSLDNLHRRSHLHRRLTSLVGFLVCDCRLILLESPRSALFLSRFTLLRALSCCKYWTTFN